MVNDRSIYNDSVLGPSTVIMPGISSYKPELNSAYYYGGGIIGNAPPWHLRWTVQSSID